MKRKLPLKIVAVVIIVIVAIAVSIVTYGYLEFIRVNQGQTIENFLAIDNLAYRIINYPTSLHDYFVPNRTTQEWNAFKEAAQGYLQGEIRVDLLLPDLVASTTPPSTNQIFGIPFSIVVNTANIGTAIATSSSITHVSSPSTGLTFNGNAILDLDVGELSGGSSVNSSLINVNCVSVDTNRQIRTEADINNTVVESIEGNNFSVYSINCDCGLVPPTNVSSDVCDENISIHWTDNSTLETSYIVYRKAEGDTIFHWRGQLPANSTSYSDLGNEDTSYIYRITAVRTVEGFGSCNVSTDSAPVLTRLKPPTLYGCWGIGSGQVRCEWTPQSAKATGYVVKRCQTVDGSGCTEFSSPNNNFYIDTSAGTAMKYYTVRAVNARNYSYDFFNTCDCPITDAAGTTSQTSNTAKHFFIVGPHNGNFDTSGDGNGIPEVDEYCNANKPAGANRGPYKAWIQPWVSSPDDPSHRISANTTYIWMNNSQDKRSSFITNGTGQPLAQDWGAPTAANMRVWVYTNIRWNCVSCEYGGACGNWSNSSSNVYSLGSTGLYLGQQINPDGFAYRWSTCQPSWPRSCSANNYIYCFEP